jgi:hypothetical protein
MLTSSARDSSGMGKPRVGREQECAMFAVALYFKSKVTGYALKYQVSIPGIGKDSCHVRIVFGAHPASDSIGIGNSASGGG